LTAISSFSSMRRSQTAGANLPGGGNVRDDGCLLAPNLDRETVAAGIGAGALAAVVSGAPSTLHALATGRDPLAATLAAGSILLSGEERRGRLLLAAIPVHLTISLGWAVVLAAVLPRRRTVPLAAAGGLAIAALDLGVIGRRFPRVRALPVLAQLADHVVYGATVGAVLAARRR
jgi:hypothetical protein